MTPSQQQVTLAIVAIMSFAGAILLRRRGDRDSVVAEASRWFRVNLLVAGFAIVVVLVLQFLGLAPFPR